MKLKRSEKKYSQKQIDEFAELIQTRDHFSLCYTWRFGGDKDGNTPLTRKDLIASNGKSLGDIFSDRLFKHFGGFTPEINKKLTP